MSKKPPLASLQPGTQPGVTGTSETESKSERFTILAISPSREDRTLLSEIADRAGWKLHLARTYREALSILCSDRMPVVLCDSNLPDGNWRDILSQLAELTDRPQLIVCALHADDQLWSEVLHMGGYDVLARPLDADEVMRVVRHAWQHWDGEQVQSQMRRLALAASA